MLKLPVCPYCNAIYRYKDVKSITHDKVCRCFHCNKKFTVSYKKGRIVILSAVALLLIVLNVLMFNFVSNVSILGCLIISVLFISLAVILFPFTVRFKKIDGQETTPKADCDNRKKKRSQKNAKRKNNRSDN